MLQRNIKYILLAVAGLAIITEIIHVFSDKKEVGPTVAVDGDEIPIKACVETYKKAFGKAIDSEKFCTCLIPNLYDFLKNDPEQLKFLKKDQWDKLDKEILQSFFKDCFKESSTGDTTAKFTATPRIEAKMKMNLMKSLKGTEIEQTNNLDSYCGCLAKVITTNFTTHELIATEYQETEKFKTLDDSCLEATKISGSANR